MIGSTCLLLQLLLARQIVRLMMAFRGWSRSTNARIARRERVRDSVWANILEIFIGNTVEAAAYNAMPSDSFRQWLPQGRH